MAIGGDRAALTSPSMGEVARRSAAIPRAQRLPGNFIALKFAGGKS